MTFIVAVLGLRLGFSARFTGMYGCVTGSFYLCVKNKKKNKTRFWKATEIYCAACEPRLYLPIIFLPSYIKKIFNIIICLGVSDRWHPAIFGEAHRSRPKRKYAVRSSHVGYWYYRENGQNFRYSITGRN